jgi:asparagine synthase (glutamine-hydrolysing)
MASLAAVLSFGPKSSPELLVRMGQAVSPSGFPGVRHWNAPPVGLASCSSRPASGGLHVDPQAGYGITYDGRLDNRDELLESLGKSRHVRLPDIECILACYQKWGPEGFGNLVGDFAFALWDGPRRRLLCVRDALGMRPLFYHHDDRRLACGSSIRQLFCDPKTTQRLAKSVVADYLSGNLATPDSTFFDEVYRLPAGHWLEAECDGTIRIRRFWNPSAIPLVEGKPAAWYAEEFRERFFKAVRSRLRTTSSRIGLHISGGFDSAAVAATVHHWNRELSLGLEPWAFVNVGSHPLTDERRYVQSFLTRYPMPVEQTASEDYWGFKPAPLVRQFQDEPHESAYNSRLVAELESARRLGIEVVLSGNGGDEIGGNSWYLIDLLLRGRVRRIWPEWKARAAGRRQSSLTLLRALVSGLAHWVRRTPLRPIRPPDWIHPELARQRHFPRRWSVSKGPIRDDIFSRLRFCWTEPLMSAGQEIYSHFGVELRHPFLDRRLFEWALSVPPFRLGENGCVKAPLRQALAGLLPDTITRRPDKGNYLPYWDLGLRVKERQRILGLLDRPVSADFGYIDAGRLRRAYENYCRGGAINRQQLWNALTLESWLRNRYSSAPRHQADSEGFSPVLSG